ncbi:hypothetical protein THAOC_20948 [Thalassiosira oceanica]|uniref:Uncharacterized protein n=1 Tax=Thalassiosira oceanica TaxID=159749 RepID=K0S255_THAOC|nr:hypothetical protein THAOC_20948 [Thalassiosira oceanica]|eukprot:EJK58894.1 hypothetical protein THAOC_20948 [Thalassiosira oceanica]
MADPSTMKLGNTFSYDYGIFSGGHPIRPVFSTPWSNSDFLVVCVPCIFPKAVQDAIRARVNRLKSIFQQCDGRSDYYDIIGNNQEASSALLAILEDIISFKQSGVIANTEPGVPNDTNLQNCQYDKIKLPNQSRTLLLPGVPLKDVMCVGPRCAVLYREAGSGASDVMSRSFTTDDSPSGVLTTMRRVFSDAGDNGFEAASQSFSQRLPNLGRPPDILCAPPSLDDMLKDPSRVNVVAKSGLHLVLPYLQQQQPQQQAAGGMPTGAFGSLSGNQAGAAHSSGMSSYHSNPTTHSSAMSSYHSNPNGGSHLLPLPYMQQPAGKSGRVRESVRQRSPRDPFNDHLRNAGKKSERPQPNLLESPVVLLQDLAPPEDGPREPENISQSMPLSLRRGLRTAWLLPQKGLACDGRQQQGIARFRHVGPRRESADLDETEKALLNFTGHFSKAPSKKRRRDIIVIDD